MKRLLFLIGGLCFYLSAIQAQCPQGFEATVVNRVDNMDGTCSFDLELYYGTDGGSDASLVFTISICGGATLFVTNCFENLESASSPYFITFSDPALVAACDDDICVTYEAWTASSCNPGSECTPVDNGVVLIGNLPVDLSLFYGAIDSYHKINLEWVTESEENNAFFEIERSRDGLVFEKIGRVTGNGNTFSRYYYSFLDKQPGLGENYYRLKQVDFDGSYTYSELIMVEMVQDLSTLLSVAPSVAESEVDILFSQLPRTNYLIEIFDSNGVNIHNIPIEPEVAVVNLDVSDYQPGMYFIRVPIGREFVIKRFVKLRD